MLSRLVRFSFLLIFLFSLPSVTSATLLKMDTGGDVFVHDTDTDLWWVSDIYSDFSGNNYSNQQAIIDTYNTKPFAGVTGWSFATLQQTYALYTSLNTYFMDGISPQTFFDNPGSYWSGRVDDPLRLQIFNFQASGFAHDEPFSSNAANYLNVGAWVVTSAPAPVPEPATMTLLSIGLVGLVGFGRKKIKGK